jgi:hypothetical protein
MTYNPYLLRRELDALHAQVASHAQRGRNLSAVRTHLDMAEAHLARRPRWLWANPQTRLKQAHRAGYAALGSLNEARVGRPVGAAIGMPSRTRPGAQKTTRCDACGAPAPLLTICNDVLCEACFLHEAVAMQRDRAYWSAPNDATFHTFDGAAARRHASHEADRVLRGRENPERDHA